MFQNEVWQVFLSQTRVLQDMTTFGDDINIQIQLRIIKNPAWHNQQFLTAVFSFTLLMYDFCSFFMFLSTIGFRGPDNHKVRKDIEKDIFIPLGPYYLRRA